MPIIIEQSLEWQTPLYTVFVDFQKAFDSVDRDVIWRLMYHYSFPPKFVAIIQQLYEGTTCQVIHDGKLTEPFSVQTGVRQGCLLSPTISLMVVDWVMWQSTAGQRTGIQWTFTKQLEDLDFADDISLLPHKQQDAQEKLCWVAAEAEKIGLQINIGKTEVMRVNNKQDDPLRLHQENIKEVDKFVYLGTVVSKDGGTDEDIKCRINKARHAFNTLRPIWRSIALSLRNKTRIFTTNVKSVLLYGLETWRVTKTNTHKSLVCMCVRVHVLMCVDVCTFPITFLLSNCQSGCCHWYETVHTDKAVKVAKMEAVVIKTQAGFSAQPSTCLSRQDMIICVVNG